MLIDILCALQATLFTYVTVFVIQNTGLLIGQILLLIDRL